MPFVLTSLYSSRYRGALVQDFLQLIVNGKEDGLFSRKHIVSNENDTASLLNLIKGIGSDVLSRQS